MLVCCSHYKIAVEGSNSYHTTTWDVWCRTSQ